MTKQLSAIPADEVQHSELDLPGTAVPYLRLGQCVSLVHWDHCPDGWSFQTIVADYGGRDPLNWHLTCRGKPLTLRRSEWAIFA